MVQQQIRKDLLAVVVRESDAMLRSENLFDSLNVESVW